MLRLWVLITGLTALAAPAFADAEEVAWSELPDVSKQVYDDPYAALDYEVLEEVIKYARLEEKLKSGVLSDADRPMAETQLAQSRVILDAEGIDVDWLLSQRWVVAERREAAAVSANPLLDGQEVTLSGFAIAAPPDPDGTNVVYLVPMPGMCSHMPPPPPNQMVRVRLGDGWTPARLHEPVRVSGKLDIAWSEQVMHVVDGPVPMRSSFSLEAHTATSNTAFFETVPQTNEWVEGLAERIRSGTNR